MDLTRIRSIVTPAVEALGYRVVLVELAGGRRAPVLRVYIEREAMREGVTVDDCVRVSRRLEDVTALDAEFPGSYHLEVSSPGVERPLVGEQDYLRFVGSRARILLREPRDGRRRFTGDIVGVENGEVRIDLESDGGVRAFRLDEISKANLKPDFADLFQGQ